MTPPHAGERHGAEDPYQLPFEPEDLGRQEIAAALLGSLAVKEGSLPPELQLQHALRIATSLEFLAGAVKSRFIGGIDARISGGTYDIDVAL